jgi:prolyl 4-hydroxylase
VASTFTGCLAIVLTIFPGFRQYISSSQLPGALEQYSFAHSQSYTTIAVSTDPLLIYISDFLSLSEIDHILKVTDELFVPSRVYAGSSSHRNSSSCVLPLSDPIHELVVRRSKHFLDKVIEEHPAAGLSYFDIEPLQLVRYGPSEYYHKHVDWFDTLHKENKGWNSRLYNRGASFFIYLEDECEGGGTEFPEISGAQLPESIMERSEKGISFIPQKGNGLFWVNLKPDGIGDDRLIHAGLPVKKGRKVGMNIWVKRDFGW